MRLAPLDAFFNFEKIPTEIGIKFKKDRLAVGFFLGANCVINAKLFRGQH
jgi:hypothetical protein